MDGDESSIRAWMMNYGHRFLAPTAFLLIGGFVPSLVRPEGFRWLLGAVGLAALIGGVIGAIHELTAKANRMSPGMHEAPFLSFRTDVFHVNMEEDAKAVVVLSLFLGGTSVIIAQIINA